MKSVLVAMKDVKSGFLDPISFRSLDLAKAQFISFLQHVHDNPEEYFVPARDFQLWHLGEYDSESGVIEPCFPVLLVSGDSVNFEEVSDEK